MKEGLVSSTFGVIEMRNEEKIVKEEQERGERVLVPVKRKETINEEEILKKPAEKMWRIPRRWRVY